MLVPGENSPKSWLVVTILVSTIIAYCESSGGKTLDIKIGFDLTQGAIGAPSLRIRDFEDSREYNPRALDGESSNDDSSSEKKNASTEELLHPKKEESSKENLKPEKSADEEVANDEKSDSGDDNTVRITRGPTGDLEPEEDDPKIHEKYEKNSESDNNSEVSDRRYKRQIGSFGNVAKRR